MSNNNLFAKRKTRRSETGASIVEFGASFYAFCIVIMIPTINFLSFAIAYSYSFLCANQIADHVAQAITPKRAFQILNESATNLESDSLAKLFKISASKEEYQLTPFQLALVKTNAKGDNLVVASNITDIKKLLKTEQNNTLIQYEVTTSFSHQPLLELKSVPIINQIPVIGKETKLSFKMLRHPEHLSEHSL